MRHSNPPRCSAHREDDGPPVGAPPGNQNRTTHGFYRKPNQALETIGDVITDLMNRQSELSSFIHKQAIDGELTTDHVLKFMHLHASTASRLGRLLRDQKALEGPNLGQLFDVIGQALDELSDELGIEL